MRILLFLRFILHYICLNNVNSMDQTTPHHMPCFLAPSQPCCNWLCHWRGTHSCLLNKAIPYCQYPLSNLSRKSGGNITLKHAHKHWAHLVWHGTVKDFSQYEWYGFIILPMGGGGRGYWNCPGLCLAFCASRLLSSNIITPFTTKHHLMVIILVLSVQWRCWIAVFKVAATFKISIMDDVPEPLDLL